VFVLADKGSGPGFTQMLFRVFLNDRSGGRECCSEINEKEAIHRAINDF
jgi:hypothetical protein